MPYSINQEVTYTSITGHKKTAKIISRKVDFENGSIKTEFASGNFDYIISFVNDEGIVEKHFCQEENLE